MTEERTRGNMTGRERERQDSRHRVGRFHTIHTHTNDKKKTGMNAKSGAAPRPSFPRAVSFSSFPQSLAGIQILVIFTLCSILTGFPSSSGFAQTQPPQEQIWDHEVKRWLTPEELGHLEIYFTEDDAAKVMFPDSERIRRETLTLTAEQKSFVEQVIGWEFPEFTFDVFIGETQGNIDGYAVIQNTIGKHRPITYMVGVSSTGECTNFEVLVYREARGNEIATKRFNYQYQGKTIGDPVRINRDIINITGATMSVRSASAGVKRVLVLVNEFYLKPLGLGRDVLAATSKEKGFFEALLGL